MRKFTADELDRFSFTAENSFMDSCQIYVYSGYENSDGQVTALFPTTVSGVECGFYPTKSLTNFRGELIVPEFDGILRLSLDQTVTLQDEILIRDTRYGIDGIQTGRTIQTVTLKELSI